MRKKIFGVVIVLLFGCWVVNYFYSKYSYAEPKEYFTINSSKKNRLKIGIIGDSWVVRQRLDSLISQELADKKIEAEVFSSGNPGAPTKIIYENLFKEENEIFSSKKILLQQPDYCIVIAGVNDAAKNLGPRFYSHHMIMIIRTLLHYNIQPVIVTLPEFGIEEDFSKKTISSKLGNKLASVFLNEGHPFEIKDYRNELIKEIKENNLKDKTILLDFDEVCNDYNANKNLYSDPLHLNKKEGYPKFSNFLAEKLKTYICNPQK